jgi:hypothetical protein
VAKTEETGAMSGPEVDLSHQKRGMAILVTCIVQTLNESDPTFEKRFLARLGAAYYDLRDNTEGDVRHEMELLTWTREFLTGWSNVSGQGKPFLDR